MTNYDQNPNRDAHSDQLPVVPELVDTFIARTLQIFEAGYNLGTLGTHPVRTESCFQHLFEDKADVRHAMAGYVYGSEEISKEEAMAEYLGGIEND